MKRSRVLFLSSLKNILCSDWSEEKDQIKNNSRFKFFKFSWFAVVMTNKLLLCAGILFILNSGFEFQCNAQDLKGNEKNDTSNVIVHSPKMASFYSAAIPGLGQIYNKKYWKVPILYAGIGALIYSIQFNHNYYQKFKRSYIANTSGDPVAIAIASFRYAGIDTKNASPANLRSAMDYYRRYRDMSVLGLAAVYLAGIIDATVDAYFYDYDVSQDLSLRIKPTIINSAFSYNFGVSCAFRF